MPFGQQSEGFNNPENLSVQNITITTGSINGLTYEINKNGFFFYFPTKAAGNLVASIAPVAGTDRFGNAYLAGFTSYDPNVTGNVANLLAGVLTLQNTGFPTQVGAFISFANASMTLSGARQAAAFANQILLAGGGSGATVTLFKGSDGSNAYLKTTEPNNFGSPSAWHGLSSFAAGWSVGGEVQYKIGLENMLHLRVRNLVHDGVTANPDGSVILSSANGVPTQFRPPSARRFAVYCNQIRAIAAGPPTTTSGAALELETDGSLQCFGMAQACTRVDGYATLTLDI